MEINKEERWFHASTSSSFLAVWRNGASNMIVDKENPETRSVKERLTKRRLKERRKT